MSVRNYDEVKYPKEGGSFVKINDIGDIHVVQPTENARKSTSSCDTHNKKYAVFLGYDI